MNGKLRRISSQPQAQNKTNDDKKQEKKTEKKAESLQESKESTSDTERQALLAQRKKEKNAKRAQHEH